MTFLNPATPPPWSDDGHTDQWYRPSRWGALPSDPPRYCMRCGNWFRAEFYVGHAWNERP